MNKQEWQKNQAEQALGSMLYGVVRALIQSGLRPAAAMRVAAFVAIDGSIGRGALRQLGLPVRTERRWRAEVRDAVAAASATLPDEAPIELLNELLPLMGLDVEVRPREGGESDG